MLREYQKKAIQQFENSTEKNILLSMATGSGKTFTFCEIAKRFFAENAKRVMILVHRQELLQQAYDSLGERCFKIEKGLKNIPFDYDFYVAMVETTNRRLNLLPEFGLVIIDECHIGNFKKMPYFTDNNVMVLGVTATPINEEPLSNYYGQMISPVDISHLISDGHLVNCDAYGFASDLVKAQKWKTRGGDFDEKEMEEFYSSEKMVKNVIEAYWSHLAGKKTLIFNVNLKHNEAVYLALKSEGLPVYQITGETTTEERKRILNNFKTEKSAIICNVGVLTTGFDEPTIEGIILNRATKSLSLYLQMIGRGARTSPNKEKFIVLDLGRNTLRHGFYDSFIDWETYFKNGKKKKDNGKEGAMPIKECPQCHYTQHTRKTVCENCGYDFVEERERQMKEEKVQKMYLLIKEKPMDIPIDRLFQIADERKWKPYAVIHKIADHVANYKQKYDSIIDIDYCNAQALESLEKWCRHYGIKNNKWHQELIKNEVWKRLNQESSKKFASGIGTTI